MIRFENVFKMSCRHLSMTSWRSLKNVLKTFLQDVLMTSSRRVGKTSWRRITKTNILVLIKTSWTRLEAVFWRRMTNGKICVFIETSWRRLLKTKTYNTFKMSSRHLHQDQYLLEWMFSFLFVFFSLKSFKKTFLFTFQVSSLLLC